VSAEDQNVKLTVVKLSRYPSTKKCGHWVQAWEKLFFPTLLKYVLSKPS